MVKGTVHQMYECCSKVLLHLGRMLGVVFMVQRGQIWPKNTKTCFDKMYRVPFRSATRSFEKCHPFLSEVPPVPFRCAPVPLRCAPVPLRCATRSFQKCPRSFEMCPRSFEMCHPFLSEVPPVLLHVPSVLKIYRATRLLNSIHTSHHTSYIIHHFWVRHAKCELGLSSSECKTYIEFQLFPDYIFIYFEFFFR